MNEQIKQLAEQAKRNEPFDCGALTKDQWLEKFAELIVQECAKIADVADENECEWIGGNILTHFGVKE